MSSRHIALTLFVMMFVILSVARCLEEPFVFQRVFFLSFFQTIRATMALGLVTRNRVDSGNEKKMSFLGGIVNAHVKFRNVISVQGKSVRGLLY